MNNSPFAIQSVRGELPDPVNHAPLLGRVHLWHLLWRDRGDGDGLALLLWLCDLWRLLGRDGGGDDRIGNLIVQPLRRNSL